MGAHHLKVTHTAHYLQFKLASLNQFHRTRPFRFESWTTPEYYEKADAALQNTKLQSVKQAELLRRREALRKLLADEADTLEQELKQRSQTRGRGGAAPSTETLRSINDTFRRTAEEKRRTDLESKIYQQWRHAAREDVILHESKSDHEAMAKMNWLDRQIVMQMDREAENRSTEERTLRLHEESRKRLECLADRRAHRDAEIAEQKAFQEAQIGELKKRSRDTDALRAVEQRLRKRLLAVDAEQSAVAEAQANRQTRMQQPFVGSRRIKLVLRQRSDAVCDALREDCALLGRLSQADGGDESVAALRAQFERVLADEQQKKLNVEAMYESEVKHLLAVQERQWSDEAAARARSLQRVIARVAEQLRDDLSENMRRQRDLVAIKESRLQTMQTSNQRLKELLADQRADELSLDGDLRTLEIGQQKTSAGGGGPWSPLSSAAASVRSGSSQSGGSIVDSLRGGGSSMGSELSVPRFGRKKIAWT